MEQKTDEKEETEGEIESNEVKIGDIYLKSPYVEIDKLIGLVHWIITQKDFKVYLGLSKSKGGSAYLG